MSEFELHCRSCDYNLSGLPENRCPECGLGFDPDELRAIQFPQVPSIGKAGLIFHLLLVPVILAVLAFAGGVAGVILLDIPLPAGLLVSLLLLLVYLCNKVEYLGRRLLANTGANSEEKHVRRRFLLRWGTPLLFMVQITIVVASLICIFAFLLPDLE